jgi:hypothetical protein
MLLDGAAAPEIITHERLKQCHNDVSARSVVVLNSLWIDNSTLQCLFQRKFELGGSVMSIAMIQHWYKP